MINVIQKILYVLNDDIYLHLQGEALVLKQEEIEKLRIPLNSIEQIIIFGNVVISNHLVKACSNASIVISYLNTYGNFIGRFYGQKSGNVFLRKNQYLLYEDDEKSLCLAKNIMLAKFLNSANLLKYYSRFHKDREISNILYDNACKIIELSKQIKEINSIDNLRGLEGAISSIYFSKSKFNIIWRKQIRIYTKYRIFNIPINIINHYSVPIIIF